MAKNTPGGYISLNDFMGFMEEHQLTTKEEKEIQQFGGGNVSYVRVVLKVDHTCVKDEVVSYLTLKSKGD